MSNDMDYQLVKKNHQADAASNSKEFTAQGRE